MSQLSWDVFVAPELALVHDDPPPGLSTRTWGPASAILITGRFPRAKAVATPGAIEVMREQTAP